jgi:hypothetical protein
MAIRLTDTDKLNTQQLLAAILIQVREDKRVSFLCAAGNGGAVMQRIRVALSRVRKTMEEDAIPIGMFTLRNSIHPETHESRRYDCVVVWRERNDRHETLESLEDLLERKAS